MNIFDIPSGIQKNEIITSLLEDADKKIKIERIVSTGQTTDWYNQDENEFVILLTGFAKLEFENNEIIELVAGDCIYLPAHKKHRVCFTSENPPCVWLCVFWA